MNLKFKFNLLLVFCEILQYQTRILAQSQRRICGKVQVGRANIVGGQYSTRGSFPWVAILIKNDGSVFCGGTILTEVKVLSAAHCFHGKDNQYKFTAPDIMVIVGAHNLNITHERGKYYVGIERIDVHEDWNPHSSSFDADIAMLSLTDVISFTRYIQPICLIDSNSFLTRMWNGYTVGYGKSELDRDSESVLKSLLLPIEPSNEECFYTNDFLMKISSNRSFCGGSRDGSGVCLGDSGNGLFTTFKGTYFLRGIVSSSLYTNNNCDVYNYAIFTDVPKFYDWIINKLSARSVPYASSIPSAQIKLGTAFCTYEHTTSYKIELSTEIKSGFLCSLDLDYRGVRVERILSSLENEDEHNTVTIIKVIKKFQSYLTTFPSTFCSQFKKLEIIDMSGADIETVEPNSLNYCKNLIILQFNRNKIQELPENLLAQNKKLQKIYITSNSIQTLSSNFFSELFELIILDLSKNRIKNLPADIFENLKNLQEINLEGNSLATLQIGTLLNLKSLNINDNRIHKLPTGIFSDLRNIKTLLLRNNKLTIIQADAFPQNSNIQLIDFTNNNIATIDESIFDKCEVSNLKLEGNVCVKTNLIGTKDLKTKLTPCFRMISTTIRTTYTTTSTRQIPRISARELEPWIEPCGVSRAPVQNIIGGTEVKKGSYPWIAVLIDKNGKYFCGGTLVSKRLVVTAAHCVFNKNSELTPGDLIVLLGAHNLSDESEIGRKTHLVADIRIDIDWNPHSSKFDADIAILKMNDEVKFGAWIQPVCLPKVSAPLKNFNFGEVVGFGKFDKTGTHSNIPRKANTPIRKSEDCYNEFPDLLNIASHRTFCGGYANGTGACTGDSGGGLTVVQDEVHYLRGIVSASIQGTNYGCDVESYTIFTDIRFYMNFIKAFIKA